MNTLNVVGKWNEVKLKLMQRYTVLSDEDLALRFGKEGEMIGRLQRKLGMSRADIMRLIGELN